MYEVEKYVFVWKDVPKPENTDRGVWKKISLWFSSFIYVSGIRKGI